MESIYEKQKKDFRYGDCLAGNNLLTCTSHLHHHIELVYLRQGRTEATVDSESYTLESDSIFITLPNQIHAYRSSGREEYILMLVNPDRIPELTGLIGNRLPVNPILRNVSAHPALISLIELINDEMKRDDETLHEAALHGLALSLFAMLFRLMPLTEQKPGESDTMRQVVDFCVRNYNRDLSLEILAAELHMSKYTISHLFSRKFHMRFDEYINTLRVTEACRYLDTTDKSVTEISTLVGFGTMRTFNRAFLKHLSASPSQYRSNRQSMENSVITEAQHDELCDELC